MARRALTLLVLLLGGAALAGTKLIQNDTFTGAGSVNAGVSFGEYQGAAVMFEPPAGEYPLKIIAIDVLCVPYMSSGSGTGAYELDVWDESGGTVGAPRPLPNDGGTFYPGRVSRQGVQLMTSLGQFNRFTLQSPVTVSAGKVFVKVSQQLQTSFDNTTIALDLATAPKPGANFFFDGFGYFHAFELPDGGAYNNLKSNWVIRLVLEVPDVAITVTSITPSSAPVNASTSVVIAGTNFELGAKAFLGTTELTVTSLTSQTVGAIVPSGLAPGRYDVRVRNLSGVEGVLPNGFEVLQVDGGSGTGGGAGGGGAGTGGGASTGGGTGTGGGGGTTNEPLSLLSVTPTEAYVEDNTGLFLTGTGFEAGARVLVGGARLDEVTVESSAIISATLPSNLLPPGKHDVTVLNLDGEQATLPKALTLSAGSRARPGCSCAAPDLAPLLLLGLGLLSRRRTKR